MPGGPTFPIECRIHGVWWQLPFVSEDEDTVTVKFACDKCDSVITLPKVDNIRLVRDGVARYPFSGVDAPSTEYLIAEAEDLLSLSAESERLQQIVVQLRLRETFTGGIPSCLSDRYSNIVQTWKEQQSSDS